MFAVVSVCNSKREFVLAPLSLSLPSLAPCRAARESRVSINICALAKRRNVLSVNAQWDDKSRGEIASSRRRFSFGR